LAAALLLIGYSVYSASNRVQATYQEETAQLRDIATYYSFSGHLSPVTDEIQTATETLKVKELYVHEGDKAALGQALLRATNGTRVYASEQGIIDELFVKADDTLQPGAQIARIVDYDTLEVSVDVDEYDIRALEVGKQGTVYLNALDKTMTGTVAEISRDATTEGGVSYYAVKMEIEATEDIRSGMSVEVNLLNQQALGTMSVANKALSYDEYNKPFVLVKAVDGQMQPQYVTLGVSDGLYTQITEGVAEGQSVYYAENDMLRFFMMRPGNMMNGASN
jgi:HlyD family secretion protein